MSVYVDPLMDHGWVLRGRVIRSCHMFTDEIALLALHELAARIGMKRAWFQMGSIPHYDLVPSRRELAIAAGAIEVDRHQAVEIWRNRRAAAAVHAGCPPRATSRSSSRRAR